MTKILYGDVWLFDPEPTKGREIGKKIRPALIVSNDTFNNSLMGLVIIVPLSTQEKSISSHVLITPHNGGVKKPCYALCEQVRAISKERLINRYGHMHDPAVMRQIAGWLIDLLNLL